MRILVVTATPIEVAPLVATLGPVIGGGLSARLTSYSYRTHAIDVLQAGVGMVPTAVWCARALSGGHYDLALNLGVCGSFDPALPPGAVVHVVSEQMTELGAEDGADFITMQALALIGPDDPPFIGGRLVNPRPLEAHVVAELPAVRGISVNTVHGNDRSIADVVRRFAPQVESMEGAAFMYACLTHGLPFAEIRAVSNVVEPRDRSRWKMGEAIANLCATAGALMDTL
ncbi:MAG: futalosine hydrolase [Acidobacteriota bacterium]